jgi:glycosyltransferase involved in cell wall biosynthesis
MKKITWCGVAQSPYNDFLLTEVHKSFDLKVYYKFGKSSSHPWNLNSVEYDLGFLTTNFIAVFKRVLTSDIVVVSGWSFWEHLIIMLMPIKSAKKIYWTDTLDLDRKEWVGVRGYIRRIISTIVFRVFDQVWSTGKPGCEALEKLGCNKQKINSFPFFLDLTRYKKITDSKREIAVLFREKYGLPDTRIVFLCMGQVASKKRFDDAIRALAILNCNDVVLWIAGSGPIEGELRLLASDLHVSHQVRFLGWIQQDEVELAYISSDVFIHPSGFDPFPTVVLDAMTWAKPIIGTIQAGSVKDRVVHGKNGFIYTTGQVNVLCSHMRFFVENPSKIDEFGIEARKTACKYPVSSAIDKLKGLV